MVTRCPLYPCHRPVADTVPSPATHGAPWGPRRLKPQETMETSDHRSNIGPSILILVILETEGVLRHASPSYKQQDLPCPKQAIRPVLGSLGRRYRTGLPELREPGLPMHVGMLFHRPCLGSSTSCVEFPPPQGKLGSLLNTLSPTPFLERDPASSGWPVRPGRRGAAAHGSSSIPRHHVQSNLRPRAGLVAPQYPIDRRLHHAATRLDRGWLPECFLLGKAARLRVLLLPPRAECDFASGQVAPALP